jgi:hypothetical protein
LASGGAWLVDDRFGTDGKAIKILDQMSLKYSKCQTLRDRIEVRNEEHYRGKLRETKHYIIGIDFQAPASLRYEVNENVNGKLSLVSLSCAHNKKGIVTSGGLDSPVICEEGWLMDTYEIRDGKPYGALDAASRYGTLDLITVPEPFGLVMPGFNALRYSDFDDVRLRGTEKVDSHECFVLVSRQWETTLWIDKEAHVLRKVAENSRDTILLFHPEFGVPIKESAFHLDASQMAVAQQRP